MANEIVKWGGYSDEAAADEATLAKEESSSELWTPEAGRNVIRFLPPIGGRKTPFHITYQHYLDIPGTDRSVKFDCPRYDTPKGACEVCDESERLKKLGTQIDKDRGFKLKARRRVYANIIVRGKEDAGVRVFAFGKGIHEDLIKIRKDPEDGGDFTNPSAEGFDIVIHKTGEKLNTEYDVKAGRNQRALSEDAVEMKKWILKDQFDLESYATPLDDEKLAEVRKLIAPPRGRKAGGDEWDEAPRRQRASRTAADDMDDVIDGDAGPA